MATEDEIEVARCAIRDAIRAYWEADPEDAAKMVDGYRSVARAALEAAERVREQTRPRFAKTSGLGLNRSLLDND